MAEFRATKSQQQAIESMGSAVLVSAGAGSGKTRVLTERLMKRICHPTQPVDIDSFLIISYTRASAAELRGRIMDELAAAMAREPDNRRLRRQSALCSKAQIGTIHSFCASLLRENCHLLGLSPDFRIMDEERAVSMKKAALERVLEERYARAEDYPGFIPLADSVGAGRDDSRLEKITLSLHSKMQCHARPHSWARQQAGKLREEHEDVGETLWGREILGQISRLAEYWKNELDRLMEAMAAQERISAAYMPSIACTAEKVRELERCAALGWDRARDCLPIEFPRLGVLRNSPDPDLSEMIKLRRTACKKAMEGIAKTLSADSDTLLEQLRDSAAAMEALLELTLDFDREYSRDKRRAGLVDYSDLEHMSARLLTGEDGSPTELARRISLRYSEIMVDEYQDVSRVQDAIFTAISRQGTNLFLVGDVKQSIYRFRLADPGIFTEKYLSYADIENSQSSQPRRIMLQENFRSRREILNCANAVFSLCMSRQLGELDYDEDAALKPGAVYENSVPLPELMLLEVPESDEGEENPDKISLEAAMVGRKIRELMSADIKIGGRALDYGDICLLMRSANTVGGIYRRELAAMGIPVEAGQSGDFFGSVEVSVMLSMLAVIDNPHQDIPLIAVLRSPAFGFDADELSAIRTFDRSGDYYTALCAASAENEKCAAFREKLDGLRRLAPDMSAAELLWKLINDMDMLALCSAMSDGQLRRQRLMDLLELSEHFEATGHRGLHRFVLWLRQLAAKDQQPGSGSSAGRGVQIMTVHKSKGLEFPVVFLCDTARRFNRQDSQEPVLIHPELGLGPKVTDLKKRIEYPSLARNAIRLRLENEMLSEEMRLLYVALTRPREYLFITAALKDARELIKKSEAAVTVPMPAQLLWGASAPVNWLIYAALADSGRNIRMNVYESRGSIEDPRQAEQSCSGPVEHETARLSAQLRCDLEYVYPHELAVKLPSKITATELKGRREQDSDAKDRAPAQKRYFRSARLGEQQHSPTPTQRGIATHLALQYMNFECTDSLEHIEREIERLRAERFLTDKEAEQVNPRAIQELFASPLGARIRSADKVHREFKFSALVEADKFYPGAEGEKLLLQGVVDC